MVFFHEQKSRWLARHSLDHILNYILEGSARIFKLNALESFHNKVSLITERCCDSYNLETLPYYLKKHLPSPCYLNNYMLSSFQYYIANPIIANYSIQKFLS